MREYKGARIEIWMNRKKWKDGEMEGRRDEEVD